MNIVDRKDSVLYLQKKGLHAIERNWIMGETVGVFGGQLPEGPGGIKAWRYCLYIHHHESEWAVSDLDYQISEPHKCGTLKNATEFAYKLMQEKLLCSLISSNKWFKVTPGGACHQGG